MQRLTMSCLTTSYKLQDTKQMVSAEKELQRRKMQWHRCTDVDRRIPTTCNELIIKQGHNRLMCRVAEYVPSMKEIRT